MRVVSSALALCSLPTAVSYAAEPAPFDLPGPGVRITVKRGDVTLPIGEVPSLKIGDELSIKADLPEDQRAKYLLLSAFMHGATNPPPKDWIQTAETWKKKDKDKFLTLTVPEGSRQLVLFLVPETGGASDSISAAVRGRPGEFVRATQDLNQASLDRARLNTFMAGIRAQENNHPEYLRTVAPTLARSLSMKLNEECLDKVVELQATCLLDKRDSLVMADVHSSTMAENLAGAPTDLALQLSSTREAGMGYYSPYIAVVRDIARVFGAFSNPQFDYLPTLSLRQGDTTSLLLNAAPSFAKPKSVLVSSMPPIESDNPPQLRNAAKGPICASRPGVTLPVEGATVIYSTNYARNMTLRMTSSSGKAVDLPVEARADRGGYMVKGTIPAADFKTSVKGRLLGQWGFDAFDGPEFELQFPTGEAESAAKDLPTLVSGRENAITLPVLAPACVESVTLRRGDTMQQVEWKAQGATGLTFTVPAATVRPGEVTVEVKHYGSAKPVTMVLQAYQQASRLDRLTVHAGDRSGILAGQRLDQVSAVEIGGVRFKPDGLTREGEVDQLRVVMDDAATDVSKSGSATARVILSDGRTLNLPVTIAPARPRIALLNKSLATKDAAGLPLEVLDEDVLPDTARLVFSVKAEQGTRLLPGDGLEIGTKDGDATTRLSGGAGLRLQSPEIMVATLDPAALGPSAFGPLQFRIIRGMETSDWQPLATLARLPRIEAVDCKGKAKGSCTVRGQDLFLIDALAATQKFEKSTAVPQGYTGSSLTAPFATDGRLYLRLRDAPEKMVAVAAKPAAS
jgi:hypothetical protein